MAQPPMDSRFALRHNLALESRECRIEKTKRLCDRKHSARAID